MDEKNAYTCAVIENLQREDLTPIEEAEAFYRFNNEHHMTHEEIGQLVGRSRAAISNSIRLLSLIGFVRNMLENKQIEIGHARALLALPSDGQKAVAEKIVIKKLTVRETERLVKSHKQPKKTNIKNNPYKNRVKRWVENITKSLSSKTDVKINSKGEGQLIIHFSDPSEMDWLEKKLTDED